VILASEESEQVSYEGIADALALGSPGHPVDIRIFAKPKTLKNRRMGIAIARGGTIEDAIDRAKAAAARVRIGYSH
jgi:phosphoribosylglycinamide formyltransferase 2